jgi:isopropylmalate/homocitrate/citramalate synthase
VETKVVRIFEVAPRDGLQNESAIMPTDDKVRLIEMLAQSGITDIEVSSFVNPARVPQLADTEEVFARIARRPGVRYWALVPNLRGLERARAAGVDDVALFTAASDAFAQRNIGKTIEQSLAEYRTVAESALSAGMRVRAYVSTAFACPYSGPVRPDDVWPIVVQLLEMGAHEISVADTIGAARPDEVARLTESLLPHLPLDRFAYHFHDTNGAALDNVGIALQYGVRIFDSAAGGLGGCPFAPGSPGNLATESLVQMLQGRGIECGVDIGRIRTAAEWLRAWRGA